MASTSTTLTAASSLALEPPAKKRRSAQPQPQPQPHQPNQPNQPQRRGGLGGGLGGGQGASSPDDDLRLLMPSARRYERSFMHPQAVLSLAGAGPFVLSLGRQGEVRFWRKLAPILKQPSSSSSSSGGGGSGSGTSDHDMKHAQVEFAKHFQAHVFGPRDPHFARLAGQRHAHSSGGSGGSGSGGGCGGSVVSAAGDAHLCFFDGETFDLQSRTRIDRSVLAVPALLIGGGGGGFGGGGTPSSLSSSSTSAGARRWVAVAGCARGSAVGDEPARSGGAPSAAAAAAGSADDGAVSPCDVALFDLSAGAEGASAGLKEGGGGGALLGEEELVPDSPSTGAAAAGGSSGGVGPTNNEVGGSGKRARAAVRPFVTLRIHRAPVVCICYNPVFDLCVSADAAGGLACFSVSLAASQRRRRRAATVGGTDRDAAADRGGDGDDGDDDASVFPSALFAQWNRPRGEDSSALGGGSEVPPQLSELDFPALFYCFVRAKTFCVSMDFSPDGTKLATLGFDRKVRVFDFLRGKLLNTYNEAVEVYQRQQRTLTDSEKAGDRARALDPMEFGRRVAVETEIDKQWRAWADWLNSRWGRGAEQPEAGDQQQRRAAAERAAIPVVPPELTISYDGSGRYLSWGTLLGVKTVDTARGRVFALLGKSDGHLRFTAFAFFQSILSAGAGMTSRASIEDYTNYKTTDEEEMRLRMGGGTGAGTTGAGGNTAVKVVHDPTLFAVAHKKSRVYLISSREPRTGEEDTSHAGTPYLTTLEDRDIFNEAPTAEDKSGVLSKQSRLAQIAVIHTSMGDIRVRLFWEDAPKTVENFTQLARRGYYNNLIFHRVIVNFMAQTGDPTGTGMGGESAFPGGKPFEDEICLPKLKHSRYTLSMANAGPNTNGSQFFITAVPCPSLDGKHTVFGRVMAGQDVVHAIERVQTDDNDKPLEDILMLSVSTTLVGAKEV